MEKLGEMEDHSLLLTPIVPQNWGLVIHRVITDPILLMTNCSLSPSQSLFIFTVRRGTKKMRPPHMVEEAPSFSVECSRREIKISDPKFLSTLPVDILAQPHFEITDQDTAAAKHICRFG